MTKNTSGAHEITLITIDLFLILISLRKHKIVKLMLKQYKL